MCIVLKKQDKEKTDLQEGNWMKLETKKHLKRQKFRKVTDTIRNMSLPPRSWYIAPKTFSNSGLVSCLLQVNEIMMGEAYKASE